MLWLLCRLSAPRRTSHSPHSTCLLTLHAHSNRFGIYEDLTQISICKKSASSRLKNIEIFVSFPNKLSPNSVDFGEKFCRCRTWPYNQC